MEPIDTSEYFLSKIKGHRIDSEDLLNLIIENPYQVLSKVLKAAQVKPYLDEETKKLFTENKGQLSHQDLQRIIETKKGKGITKEIKTALEKQKALQKEFLAAHDLFRKQITGNF